MDIAAMTSKYVEWFEFTGGFEMKASLESVAGVGFFLYSSRLTLLLIQWLV